jgi:hypothetical protein
MKKVRSIIKEELQSFFEEEAPSGDEITYLKKKLKQTQIMSDLHEKMFDNAQGFVSSVNDIINSPSIAEEKINAIKYLLDNYDYDQ